MAKVANTCSITKIKLLTVVASVLFSFTSSLIAQNGTEGTKITLPKQNGTLEYFLYEIKNKTSLQPAFMNNDLPLQKEIVVDKKEVTLKELLETLAKETDSKYVIKNNKIIFSKKEIDSKYTISGIVRDKISGETLIGASIYIKELKSGVQSNSYGFYSITLPLGNYTLACSFLGFESYSNDVNLNNDLKLDIELNSSTTKLEEVVVSSSEGSRNVTSTEMGVHTIAINAIKRMPGLAGSTDVLKSVQMLPGVTTIGEGSTGIFVRGGGVDQNLILLDEAPVYNPSHLLGFTSVFNADALKDIKLYKGDIPAEYGGRASSVLDIRMKEGDSKKFRASGGLGILNGASLTVENPIDNGKGSFILSGRRTFADPLLWVASALQPLMKKTRLYFYDFNGKINYNLNLKNKLYLSGYFGRDINKIPILNSNINWGNITGTARWNHLFNQRLFSNFSLIYSRYNYNINAPATEGTFNWSSKIEDVNAKVDFIYYPRLSTSVKFGFNSIYHQFSAGSNKTDVAFNVPKLNALEHALYLSAEEKVSEKLTIQGGLRYSLFQNIGKATLFQFDENYNPYDTATFHSGKFYHTEGGFEPRIGINFTIDEKSSIKTSYNLNRQYLQMLSNSSLSFTSFDIWYPTGPNIKPLIAHQIGLGYFRNFRNNMFETSIEGYYKTIKNQIDFRDHASLLFNPLLEGELRTGKGYSYGLEFFLKKREGKLTGWASYTYSRSLRKIAGINDGREYPSLYDQPNKIAITANYELSDRLSISANWVYNSGSLITLPKESITYENESVPVYGGRNSYRLPVYHRLDFSMTLRKKRNLTRKYDSRWVLSVYNAYARKNPLTYYIGQDLNPEDPAHPKIIANKVYLFSIIPSISYIFNFSK